MIWRGARQKSAAGRRSWKPACGTSPLRRPRPRRPAGSERAEAEDGRKVFEPSEREAAQVSERSRRRHHEELRALLPEAAGDCPSETGLGGAGPPRQTGPAAPAERAPGAARRRSARGIALPVRRRFLQLAGELLRSARRFYPAVVRKRRGPEERLRAQRLHRSLWLPGAVFAQRIRRIARRSVPGARSRASVRRASSSLLPPRGGSPFADPPGEFLFFLYHPFRRHFCLCADSAGSRRIWRAALRDAIRYRSTELQRRDSLEAEAFLEAVRFYRQERGRYGAGDLLLGPEPEILGNVLMEDLLPVLRSQVLPSIRGSERRRQQLWLQFLQEVYTLILSEISSEFEGFQKEKEKLQIELEKKIRPDLDQMLTLKDQIASKLQAVVRSPAESCCGRGVEPHLERVTEELLRPVSSGVEAVRSLFARRVDEVIGLVRSSPVAVLQEELLTLGRTSWQPEVMHPCYEEADAYRESLRGLEERFGFRGVTSLVLGAQNLMQQLMQNATHTFQQLSQQHLGRAASRHQLTPTLGKVKERVLKKFDYDSSSVRRRFAQEWLVRIFLPFLLKQLESGCKLELPRYESFVFADFSGIINLENIYEEAVLAELLRAVGKALAEASRRDGHDLRGEGCSGLPGSAEELLYEEMG